mgnify:CR=1 FL=1
MILLAIGFTVLLLVAGVAGGLSVRSPGGRRVSGTHTHPLPAGAAGPVNPSTQCPEGRGSVSGVSVR